MAEMSGGDEQAGPGGVSRGHRLLALFNEEFILNTVFRLLAAGAVVFLAIDFSQLYERGKRAAARQQGRRSAGDHGAAETGGPGAALSAAHQPVAAEGGRAEDARLFRAAVPGAGCRPDELYARAAKARPARSAGSSPARQGISPASSTARAARSRRCYLHSPGGSVHDAVEMSQFLRTKAIDTVVPDNGYCASSCPIVFSGGKTRTAGRSAWIGVHQVYAAAAAPGDVNDGMAHAQAISAEVQDHLLKMGVDAQVWIHAMKTPSDQLYIFTPDELTQFKLATRLGTS